MANHPLFSVIGIEIEYMLVDREQLNVQPKSDIILKALAGGALVNEIALGDIAASNELVMHVLELKNNGPKPPHISIAEQFYQTIMQLQPILKQHNLQLLPTGAHPWMDPARETTRWPYDNEAIYQQYDRIFNCQGHGWANLQSMHVNLPFANDEEFYQLHNLIRLILPLLPALTASTPFLDGCATGFKNSRLHFYAQNQKRIPSICGKIIPEFSYSEAQYCQDILEPMYRDIHPFDPEKLLQFEWLNSRAAIPKFAYKAIEIRIIDSQECVQADIAIALTIQAILQYWYNQSHYYLNNPCETQRLRMFYDQTLQEGLSTTLDDAELCTQWQLPKRTMTCATIWSQLIERVSTQLDHRTQRTLEFILSHGSLSERLLRSYKANQTRTKLTEIYRQLGHCLLTNQLFQPL